MAAEWIGKCLTCNKWRTNHDTHRNATTKNKNGDPANFVLVCGFCNGAIQMKCCDDGCPHCGGTGMMIPPQPYQTKCHLCNEPTENTLGDRLTCYSCEHEVMGYDQEENRW